MNTDVKPLTVADELKLGYDGAVKMINYEGALIWSSFKAILTANTVLLGFASFVTTRAPDARLIAAPMAGFGIIICICWYIILSRQFWYYSYWLSWVKNIERRLFLSSKITMFQSGALYANGKSVPLPDEQTGQVMQWPGRYVRVQTIAKLVILLFVFLYLVILAVASFPPPAAR